MLLSGVATVRQGVDQRSRTPSLRVGLLPHSYFVSSLTTASA
jgi:hypothetical protein